MNNMTMIAHAYLTLAIICEVIGTSFLKESEQFTRLLPSIITIACYGCAFFLLSICLKSIPVGIAYGIWSGAGIVLISVVGWVVFKQHLDLPACVGIGFIIVGVLIINLLSKSSVH